MIIYCYTQHFVRLSPLSNSNTPSMEPQVISSSKECESESTSTSNWRNLPQDILLQIARHLNCTTDLPRVRGVCPEWRSIIPPSFLPTLSRSLNPPPLSRYDKLPLRLVQSRFYFLSPLPGDEHESGGGLGGRWLARMSESESGPNNGWHLLNPFNVGGYMYSEPPLTGSFNLLDCHHALELAAPFSLVRGVHNTEPISNKVVVGGWDFGSGHLSSVLVQLNSRRKGGALMSWKVGETEWTHIQGTQDDDDYGVPLSYIQTYCVLNIAFYDGCFYAFELLGWRVGIMDASCPSYFMDFIPAPDVFKPIVGDDRYTVTFQGQSYIFEDCHFVVAADSRLYLVIQAKAPPGSEKEHIYDHHSICARTR